MLLKIGKFIRLKSTNIFGKNFILVILFSLTFFPTVPSFAIDMNSAISMVSQSSTQQRSGLVIWENLGSLTQSNPINITSINDFSLIASQKNLPVTG